MYYKWFFLNTAKTIGKAQKQIRRKIEWKKKNV